MVLRNDKVTVTTACMCTVQNKDPTETAVQSWTQAERSEENASRDNNRLGAAVVLVSSANIFIFGL